MDRYTDLESHADAGLGAEELGQRRFTRRSEKNETRGDGAPTPDVATGSNPTTL